MPVEQSSLGSTSPGGQGTDGSKEEIEKEMIHLSMSMRRVKIWSYSYCYKFESIDIQLQKMFFLFALYGENSPESSCRLLLGGLLHCPSEATTVRLYICPQWSSSSSQLVKFELQVHT